MWRIVFPYSMSTENIVRQRSAHEMVTKPSLNETITIGCKKDQIYNSKKQYNLKHVSNNTSKLL
jgi:phage-related protein